MTWRKKGFIFNANSHSAWASTGAMIPTPIILSEKTVRVFLTFLDDDGIGRTGYVDLDSDNLTIKKISKSPIFEIGEPGTFDENGVLTCSVTRGTDDSYYFYYSGFELGRKIRYRLLTGLAITDKDLNLIRKFKTPVLDRSEDELFFRGGPFCIHDNGVYRMWYVAGSEWKFIDDKQMPVYLINYIESSDGINWPDQGDICISIQHSDEYGFGRPYVIKHNGIYKMFYSIRKIGAGYRLGYAESRNGIDWTRLDEKLASLDVSEDGWDSEMIAYSAVIELKGKLLMFYNGNDFGKTGFGVAEWVD